MAQRPALHSLLIFATDLAVGRAFYHDVLGFEVIRESDSSIAMRGADFDLTLFKCEAVGSSDGYSTRAGSSIAFAVTDVGKSMTNLKSHGVEFLHGVPSSGPEGRYVAFVDPFGTVHELVEPRTKPGRGAV